MKTIQTLTPLQALHLAYQSRPPPPPQHFSSLTSQNHRQSHGQLLHHWETQPTGQHAIRRALSASIDSVGSDGGDDEEFLRRIQELAAGQHPGGGGGASFGWPASVERSASSVGPPLSLWMLKRRKQQQQMGQARWDERLIDWMYYLHGRQRWIQHQHGRRHYAMFWPRLLAAAVTTPCSAFPFTGSEYTPGSGSEHTPGFAPKYDDTNE